MDEDEEEDDDDNQGAKKGKCTCKPQADDKYEDDLDDEDRDDEDEDEENDDLDEEDDEQGHTACLDINPTKAEFINQCIKGADKEVLANITLDDNEHKEVSFMLTMVS